MRNPRIFTAMLAAAVLLVLAFGSLPAQAQMIQVTPPGFGAPPAPPRPQPQPSATTPPAGASATTAAPANRAAQATPGAATPSTATPSTTTAAPPADPGSAPNALVGGINITNVSLVEVVDSLCRELKLNYVMDKGVSGAVTLNTYGEIKSMDKRALLDTILRINGFALVQSGEIHRIVPLADLAHMPLKFEKDIKDIPEDDRPMLNLVFLKYAAVDELMKLVKEFLGPQGNVWSYPPSNLLLVIDSRRNMKRTMDLVAMFDSDSMAKQRVKLFDVKHGKPSDLAKELENLLKSISLSKESAAVKFVPVDRINTLIAVAPNPGVFDQIQEWLDKLDVKVKNASGKLDTYVYRVKYGRAQNLSMAIMMLYMQMYPGAGMYGMNGMYGGGMYGGGMYGGMSGMYGNPMYGGMGGMYGGGMYGGMGGMYGGGMYGGGMYGGGMGGGITTGVGGGSSTTGTTGGSGATSGNTSSSTDMTGNYMGMGGMYGGGMYGGMGMMGMRSPRVVPNVSDNSLLILATPEEYEGVIKLLTELDIPPRQVLIEMQIYEVALTGSLSWGVNYFLKNREKNETSNGRTLLGSLSNGALGVTGGALVSHSKQLLAIINTQEISSKTKVISAPSVIATDSVAASINVGTEVPTLQAQAVSGVQQSGTSLFANSISSRKTGVQMNITARVSPSGVVTMEIDQTVSTPQAPAASAAIQSPSFSERSVKTQVTVQDGDMVAIGGIISETALSSSTGLPVLSHIPWLGAAFSNKSNSKERTELVIFLTPRVIYDNNDLTDASDELVSRMKRIQRIVKD